MLRVATTVRASRQLTTTLQQCRQFVSGVVSFQSPLSSLSQYSGCSPLARSSLCLAPSLRPPGVACFSSASPLDGIAPLSSTTAPRATRMHTTTPTGDTVSPQQGTYGADKANRVLGFGARDIPRGLRHKKIYGRILRACADQGFRHFTEIQRKSFPVSLKGGCVVISSRTGTGKTVAYSIPMLQRVDSVLRREAATATEGTTGGALPRSSNAPVAIVLTPTQELATQAREHISDLCKYMENIRVVDIGHLKTRIEYRGGVDVLVATPGRLLSLLPQRQQGKGGKGKDAAFSIDLSHAQFTVIDEADKMLSMGLFPHVKEVWRHTPRYDKRKPLHENPQTFLVSATLIPEVEDLVRRLAPVHTRINLNKRLQPASKSKHIVYPVHSRRKQALLLYLLRRKGSYKGQRALIFARTRQRVERLAQALQENGITAEAMHKERSRSSRDQALQRFRDEEVQVLVATDILARGIDLPHLPVVFNYDVPPTYLDYLHRSGRTARAGDAGHVVTLVSKEPQILTVARQTVELDEQVYLEQLRERVERLEERKVPGPWRDDVIVSADDVSDGVPKRRASPADPRGASSPVAALRAAPVPTPAPAAPSDGNDEAAVVSVTDGAVALSRELGKEMRRRNFEKLSRMSGKAAHTFKKDLKAKKLLKAADDIRLRDFREGRYEDVIEMIDDRRGRKAGIIPPTERGKKARQRRKRMEKRRNQYRMDLEAGLL
eukprot:TRINITY_DN2830_c0_g1_i1.p1 TRINITY_DN2830_c0_g1~~TRINITY_DN2830_c0_g1_i1.p1  ORF type:complete len:720 (-),score=91.51 TRINITY_DN2830_c0_g1_i1:191-2350(-)